MLINNMYLLKRESKGDSGFVSASPKELELTPSLGHVID